MYIQGFFSINISEKNHQLCFPGLQTISRRLTLLFLYNVEVRYALQLRHLSSKIQSGHITRKSRIEAHFQLY